VLVAEHLDLDMAGIDDEFLDEDAVVAERGLRLGLGAVEAVAPLRLECAMRMPLPPPPAEALIITG
jgi:hypothetical protein